MSSYRGPRPGSCVAAAGAATAGSAGRRTAAGTTRTGGTRSTGSAWPESGRVPRLSSSRQARASGAWSVGRRGSYGAERSRTPSSRSGRRSERRRCTGVQRDWCTDVEIRLRRSGPVWPRPFRRHGGIATCLCNRIWYDCTYYEFNHRYRSAGSGTVQQEPAGGVGAAVRAPRRAILLARDRVCGGRRSGGDPTGTAGTDRSGNPRRVDAGAAGLLPGEPQLPGLRRIADIGVENGGGRNGVAGLLAPWARLCSWRLSSVPWPRARSGKPATWICSSSAQPPSPMWWRPCPRLRDNFAAKSIPPSTRPVSFGLNSPSVTTSCEPCWPDQRCLSSGANMNLPTWLTNRWITAHQSSRQEIADLLGVAERDLADSQVPGLSPDWRLAIAYNAACRSPLPPWPPRAIGQRGTASLSRHPVPGLYPENRPPGDRRLGGVSQAAQRRRLRASRDDFDRRSRRDDGTRQTIVRRPSGLARRAPSQSGSRTIHDLLSIDNEQYRMADVLNALLQRCEHGPLDIARHA